MTTIKPNGTRVYAEIIRVNGESKGGVITDMGGAVATDTAIIKAIGPDCSIYGVDTTILLSQRCGSPINIEGKEYIVLKESDVLGEVVSE